ncbi:MAG: hypothetical protein ABR971_13000 [Acidobacteriaceae bacterium]|jgi:DnaJ-domain-containing protein 1
MSRPLIQKRVDELEALFEAQQSDPQVLRALEAELAFRSVPRASVLLVKVKRVLDGGTVLPPPTQNNLFEQKPPVAVQPSPSPDTPKMAAPPLPEMSVEEALKTLKVAPAAAWETVESSRRQAVEKARPDTTTALSEEKRAALQLEARRANNAYATLLMERSR